jgi:hypothetical protein
MRRNTTTEENFQSLGLFKGFSSFVCLNMLLGVTDFLQKKTEENIIEFLA